MDHVFYKCESDCMGCHICRGGLQICTHCRRAEGDLEPECPGVLTEEESQRLVMTLEQGRASDLEREVYSHEIWDVPAELTLKHNTQRKVAQHVTREYYRSISYINVGFWGAHVQIRVFDGLWERIWTWRKWSFILYKSKPLHDRRWMLLRKRQPLLKGWCYA